MALQTPDHPAALLRSPQHRQTEPAYLPRSPLMTSKSMTFRFPALLAEAIETQARATGRDRTTVVAEALAQVFGLSLPSKAPITIEMLQQQIEQTENSVFQLSEQFSALRQALQAQNDVVGRLSAVEQLVVVLKPLLSGTADSQLAGLLPQSAVDIVRHREQECGLERETTRSRLQLKARLDDQDNLSEQILAAFSANLFVCDRAFRLIYINPLGARSLGLEPSRLLHQSLLDVDLPTTLKTRLTAQIETVFMTGQSITGEVSMKGSRSEPRDYEYTLNPVPNEVGQIDAVLGSISDITEQRVAAAAVTVAGANYQNLFESTHDAIVILDVATQQLLNANGNIARWLGYTRQELVRLSINDIMPALTAELSTALSQQLRASGQVRFEHYLRRKDGSTIPVVVNNWLVEYGDRLAIQSFIREIVPAKPHAQ